MPAYPPPAAAPAGISPTDHAALKRHHETLAQHHADLAKHHGQLAEAESPAEDAGENGEAPQDPVAKNIAAVKAAREKGTGNEIPAKTISKRRRM